MVDFQVSEKLVGMFDCDKCEVIVHKGGHLVPALSAHKQAVTNFIQKMFELTFPGSSA